MPIRRLVRRAPAPTAVLGAAALLLSAAPLLQGSGDSAAAGEANRRAIRDANQPYAITPRRQALLNTIRYAEGTWKQGSLEGYHTLYGGGRFASLARHPEIVVVKRYTSAAAGAYQFLPGTWREASRKLQLASFRPENQDQAALYLVDRRGVLDEIDRQGLTTRAMAVLAREWDSFPTLSGRSAYGQPVKRAGDLERFYQANLVAIDRTVGGDGERGSGRGQTPG
ncbi:MAG: muramidase [Cyanobium sp.]